MKSECIQAVQAAAGRALTDAEIKGIEDRVKRTGKQLAGEDNAKWRSLSVDERNIAAAERAMQDIVSDAQLTIRRAQLQVVKTVATGKRIQEQRALHSSGQSKALVADLDLTEQMVKANKQDLFSGMLDTIEASTSGQGASLGRRMAMFLFGVENPLMSRDIALEVYAKGEAGTGNELARQGAKAWLKINEEARLRLNSAGGNIGKLEYGYIPLPDDQIRIRAAGESTYVEKTLPKVNRDRYLREDGTHMSDAEVADVLKAIYETKSMGGLNKTDPGEFKGDGMRANRGSQHRELHLKDGEAYLEYLRDFGGGSMYDAMMAHIGGIAREITLLERYGPNPESQMRLQLDIANRMDGGLKRSFLMEPESYWNVVSGASSAAKHANIAQVAQGIRAIETGGKLLSSVLSSFTDIGTFFVTTGYHKLPYWDAVKNIVHANTSDGKEFLNMHGLMAESMISDLNRWTGDNMGRNVFGRMANSAMKLSLMNAWTDTLRRAFSMTMMGGMAKLAKTDWADLVKADRRRMELKGINEADWGIIRQAQLSQFRGTNMLTPESIRMVDAPADQVNQAVAKVLALIIDESEYAVLNPDLTTRVAASGGGMQGGTMEGELARSVAQFKSFPIAMTSKHWRRMLDAPQDMESGEKLANRLMYGSALVTSLTALGAISTQAKQLKDGKDPLDMTTSKFWFKAFTQGGGLGFLGDVLLRDSTGDRSPQQGLFELLGPSFSSAAELYELVKGNIDETIAGKDTHAGAEAFRFVRGHVPIATLTNLWFAKSAFDHAGLHAIQEIMSPGYLSRMEQRAHKDWNQEFYWKPGAGLPDRGPDFGKVIGQ
jgi:hypothetical protein